MNKGFNLLSLHDDVLDRHPRSWICIKSENLGKIIFDLESEITKNHLLTRESLSREMASCFKCSHGVIKQLFQGKKSYYPIPFLISLFRKAGKLFLLKSLQIASLKVNSASAKPVKPPYKLNNTLAKILGAFMADGSLSVQLNFTTLEKSSLYLIKEKLLELDIPFSQGHAPSRNEFQLRVRLNKSILFQLKETIYPLFNQVNVQIHYGLNLVDEHKDNVEMFNVWMKDAFGVSSRLKRHYNAWRVDYSNKVVSRYLMNFFEVSPGPKAYTAFEPLIIKKSSLLLRKEFAKGVLMFDGHVTQSGTIAFSSVSKDLFNSIKEIWSLDVLAHFTSFNKVRGDYVLSTKRNNPICKLEAYFEENTTKANRLKWVIGKYDNDPIPVKENSKVSFTKLIDVIMRVGVCDTTYLSNLFQCTTSNLRDYLKVLSKQNRIYLSRTPQQMRLDTFSPKTTILLRQEIHDLIFREIKSRFSTYCEFAQLLSLQKGTFSAMKVKKNRIPLPVLSKMISLLDIDKDLILNNIERIDREAILIKNST